MVFDGWKTRCLAMVCLACSLAAALKYRASWWSTSPVSLLLDGRRDVTAMDTDDKARSRMEGREDTSSAPLVQTNQVDGTYVVTQLAGVNKNGRARPEPRVVSKTEAGAGATSNQENALRPADLPVKPCMCFDLCSREHAKEFLLQMPETVLSASSPWYLYLKAVYGSPPQLPFDLTRLRFLYHSSTAWQHKHPEFHWPVYTCEATVPTLPWHDKWDQVMKPDPRPKCETQYCQRWLARRRNETEMERSAFARDRVQRSFAVNVLHFMGGSNSSKLPRKEDWKTVGTLFRIFTMPASRGNKVRERRPESADRQEIPPHTWFEAMRIEMFAGPRDMQEGTRGCLSYN
eukprot:TRINITY_DN53519_c0_g1_i1.p1 TRINITY_DN53519_c0_g1~~TRINITY_DN53519_c0_g1_i1.p1  ORF type:complete len:346 (+),score=28.42 TRINITY_DN53519_c0_g1_i1:51-1088(+)